MCNSLINNAGAPAYQWMYKGHPSWNSDFGARRHYDPAKAKQLPAEAGYGSGCISPCRYAARKAMGQVAEGSPAVYVRHDLNCACWRRR
jgi:ABC-type transport system substrate-binding protein